MNINGVIYMKEGSKMNNSILCIRNTISKQGETVSFKTFLITFLKHSYTKHVTRQQLLKLDRHLLQDIGISSGDAYKEASKAFWQ